MSARDAAQAVTGIADLARAIGVTPRALRHYEAEGLIASLRTRQGARLFTPHQCETARLIVLLRRLDVSIVTIRALIDPRRSETERVADLRAALQTQAEDLSRRLTDIRRVLDDPQALGRLGSPSSRGWEPLPARAA